MKNITYSKDALQLMLEASDTFSDMEHNGIRIDMKYLESQIQATHQKIANLESSLQKSEVFQLWTKLYGSSAALSKPEQLGRVLFDEMGLKCHSYTDTGKHKTDVEELEKIDHPFIQEYISWRKAEKTLNTFLYGIKNFSIDGILRPSFNLHTVLSFRSSCFDPNFQTIPSRDKETSQIVRTSFIPRKGYRLAEIDFSGAEVRAACAYHHDPVMMQYVKDDYDIHKDMAAECYKCRRDQVSKGMRGAAKGMFVFASYYGDWYMQIGQNLWNSVERDKLTLADGTPLRDHLNSVGLSELGSLNPKETVPGTFLGHIKGVHERFWNERFKVYTQWKERWWNEYLENGFFQMLTGFVCQGIYVRNACLNYSIQGTAFHWNLWVLNKLNQWLKKHKMKTKLIGQIHDSMILDVFESELQDVLSKIQELVTKGLAEHWPWINVPVAAEFSVCKDSWFSKEEWVRGSGGLWTVKGKV